MKFVRLTSGPHGRLVLVPNECPSYNNIYYICVCTCILL